MRPSGKIVGAGVLVLSLVAAACGGDDGAQSSTQATVDEAVKQGVADQLAGSTTTAAAAVAQPETMEAWEELWAEQRATIVERAATEGWGLSADGKTVTGPEGFTIDLSTCPSGWSNTEGLTDTQVKIGHNTALSGTLADYGNIARSIETLFNYYGAEGFFEDSTGKTRTINFIYKDDGYDAARTIPLVDELIDSEKVFIMWTLGSPSTLKTYDKLNQRCIPQPFSMTGHPAWGDPVNHPWTTGAQMAYNTEAVLWGAFIEQHLAEMGGKAKVAGLIMNNDFGKAYQVGFDAFLAQSPEKDNIEFISETFEPQAPTLKDPMTTLAAQQPNVFIAMMAGAPCTQAIVEAAENGMQQSADYLFISSTCKAASFVAKDKVGGDGSASNGWWIFGGGQKDFNSEAMSDDAYVVWARDLLTKAGYDYKTSGSFGTGFFFGWPMAQALKIAGELEGGLNRTNLMLATRAMDMTHPSLIEGIKFNMNGGADVYFVEGSDISQYESATQQWLPRGEPIDLSGESRPCAFDQAAATCS